MRDYTYEEKVLEAVYWRLVGEGFNSSEIGKHPDYRQAFDVANARRPQFLLDRRNSGASS